MSRGIALRCVCGVATAALLVLAVACADKVAAPAAVLSPRFNIRVTTTAQRTAAAQKLLVAAGYFRPPFPGEDPSDSLVVLGYSLADITGGPQQFNLNVDLTSCLADPARHGSLTACSLYVVAFLEPSTFDLEEHPWFGGSYDYRIAGPYDATPGHPPTVPAIDLSTSSFAVSHWEVDESLQLGGALTPQALLGPITGVAAGAGPATLFATTLGAQLPANADGSQSYGAVLAIFQNGSWRRVSGPRTTSPTEVPIFFNDVAAFAANDVYLTATDGRVYHYDGSAITPLSGAREPFRSLAVSSASGSTKFVIAGTTNGAVLVGNPSTFTRYPVPLSSVDLVCINSATEAFATSRANGSSVYRFDGTNWTSVPTASTAGKSDLQCLGPGQAYVAAGGSPGTLYRWNGTGWTAVTGLSGATGRSTNFAVVSASEMYAVGDSGSANRAFYRFDGTSWREVGRLAFATGFNRMWADPRGGAAYVAPLAINSPLRIEQVTPTSASVWTYQPQLRDVAMPTPASAFVVGGNFFLARWNGARWSVDAPPAGTPTTPTLNGVWADGANNAWAVGQQSTIVRWDGTRWNVLSDNRRPIVAPSDNYNAVWGTGGSVWIVGDVSIVRCSAAGSCATQATPGGGALYGVWGTSTTNVYTVGANGRIFHFDGTSWTPMSSPTGARISHLAGSGANDIWAAADTVILHFDGTAWKKSPVWGQEVQLPYQTPPVFQLGLWAASAREVYFGGWAGHMLRGGANWEENPFAFQGFARTLAISGAPGGCALAIADPGSSVAGTPTLLRGVGPTGCLGAPMSAPASWP